MESPFITIWTIYYSPVDFPGEYVARKFHLDKATKDIMRSLSLDELREKINNQFEFEPYRIPRSDSDMLAIIETWV
jgi:hypothetical protein